jgi:CheY-like chemotaxis protein
LELGQVVLVAEDQPTNLKILAMWLRKRGIKVVTAKDGHEAVEQFLEHKPRITLMDIQMPNKDGRVATEEIKAICPEALVIGLSGEPKVRYIQKDGSVAPFDDFHEKPFSFRLIEDLLRKAGVEFCSDA